VWGLTGTGLRREWPSDSLQRPALVAAISSEQTGMELVDEFLGDAGQRAALPQQLPPEPLGRGVERHRTKSVAHLPQQPRQMGLKPSPIVAQKSAPALDFRTRLLAVETEVPSSILYK